MEINKENKLARQAAPNPFGKRYSERPSIAVKSNCARQAGH